MSEKTHLDFKQAISKSRKSIYDFIEVGDSNYWIPIAGLESLLNKGLSGLSVAGLKNRTRSKFVKTLACAALGYPAPSSFKRTQPRFPGQQFDTYVQKSLNLQIWNEELSPTRRYVIVQVSDNDIIGKIKVVTGQDLAHLDTTGTITSKFQARLVPTETTHELVSALDTPQVRTLVTSSTELSASASPIGEPQISCLFPIGIIFDRLSPLVGLSFPDPGADQERNRGAELHRLVCRQLGYRHYQDNGQFPDIRHQLLEVKLQTSPTIDLGLILPTSVERMDMSTLGSHHPRHCDTRYAVFYAVTDNKTVRLTNLYVTTGVDFFTRFRQFGGKFRNGKIQLRLRKDFFSV